MTVVSFVTVATVVTFVTVVTVVTVGTVLTNITRIAKSCPENLIGCQVVFTKRCHYYTTVTGDSMSKQGEKRSTSKNYIFMKKYERI